MSNEQDFAKGRQVLLYTDEDGIWIAEVPSLPGCGSDGRTKEEAKERVKEAIQVYIEALVEDKLLPRSRDVSRIGSFISYVL